MKISTKSLYGTLAMLDLSIHGTSKYVLRSAIAERQQISEQYLAQLLSALRRAGYIKSARGPAGGHMLAREPRDITIAEIVELLDGPQVDSTPEQADELSSRRIVYGVFADVDRMAIDALSRITLEDLVERWRHAEGTLNFMI